MKILTVYRQASRQEVNVDKSGILFSRNTSAVNRNMAKRVLGIQTSMAEDFYLRLPLLFERSKTKEWRNIKNRIETRIQGWDGRLLSQAGRAIMIFK